MDSIFPPFLNVHVIGLSITADFGILSVAQKLKLHHFYPQAGRWHEVCGHHHAEKQVQDVALLTLSLEF